MGEIVDLASERGHRSNTARPGRTHGPAQVILYTGVRYERAEASPTNDKPKPRKRKRKLS